MKLFYKQLMGCPVGIYPPENEKYKRETNENNTDKSFHNAKSNFNERTESFYCTKLL